MTDVGMNPPDPTTVSGGGEEIVLGSSHVCGGSECPSLAHVFRHQHPSATEALGPTLPTVAAQ